MSLGASRNSDVPAALDRPPAAQGRDNSESGCPRTPPSGRALNSSSLWRRSDTLPRAVDFEEKHEPVSDFDTSYQSWISLTA